MAQAQAPAKAADPAPAPEAQPGASSKPPSAERNGQLIVSMAIVITLGIISIGLLIVGVVLKDMGDVGTSLATAIGALAASLSAPSGIANALRASSAAKPDA